MLRTVPSVIGRGVVILLVMACGLPSNAEESRTATFVMSWGKKGEAAGEFQSPIGLAFNARDELFVTDLNNARVQRFTVDGKHLGEFDLPRDTPTRKSTMIGGIAIDDAGRLFLTFMVQHKVHVYLPTGELVRAFGKRGDAAGDFHQPGGILILPGGELLVADQCNHRVQRLKGTGEPIFSWGGYGIEPGRFDGVGPKGSRFGGPHFLARDSHGDIYTTEGIQGRVQRFSSEGKFLAQWGDKSDEPGGFGGYLFNEKLPSVGPIAVAVDRHDRVYVSSLNDRVQCFDTTGRLLFRLNGTGEDKGALLHPHTMAFDRAGHLYVADSGNHRILKFRLPPAK